MFKKGDIVRCVFGESGQFTAGKLYEIREDHGNWAKVVADDAGYENGWSGSNFEIVKDTSPIRTVTRREIVPGKYGVVMIEESNAKPGTVLIDMWKANPTASELRSAARIFNEIADVLDEQKEAA